MNHPFTFSAFAPAVGHHHEIHQWVESQRRQQPGEQYIPSVIPSYISTLPSTSYVQQRVLNYNHESKTCGQQTDNGIIDASCQLTIPLDLLDQQSTLGAPPEVDLKEIVFLGPQQRMEWNSRDVLSKRAIQVLERLPSLKKITFSLDFTDLNGILETLSKIPGMQEIELTLPTAFDLGLVSWDMVRIQEDLVAGLTEHFKHLKRLTIPMEAVTAFLLSYLANLPGLESLSVRYTRHGRHDDDHPFPAWSSYRAECPGYIFIPHLKFDPRGYFEQLSRLDLGAPLSDTSYRILRTLFPKAYIC